MSLGAGALISMEVSDHLGGREESMVSNHPLRHCYTDTISQLITNRTLTRMEGRGWQVRKGKLSIFQVKSSLYEG